MKLFSTLLCAVALVAPASASAQPQVHAGLTAGGGARELRDGGRGLFHLGLSTDLILLRKKQRDVGFGPHLQLATNTFQTGEAGLGLSVLLPTGGPVFILSAAPHVRAFRAGAEPGRRDGGLDAGATATVFFGSRSYNFHGVYGYQLGVFVEGRQGFTSQQSEIFGGVHVDLAVVAMPFLFLVNAFR